MPQSRIRVKSEGMIRRNVYMPSRTSISLEAEYWQGLEEISARENVTLKELCKRAGTSQLGCNASSSVRIFVLNYFRDREAALAIFKAGQVH